MASITGTLKFGEASATVAAITARRIGSRSSYGLLLFGLAGLGAVLAGVVSGYARASAADFASAIAFGAGCGAATFLLMRRPIMTARLKRRFRQWRLPMEFPLRLDVTPEHLLYEIGDVTQIARWPAVSEVFRNRAYWIFMAQAGAIFAPRRLFTDERVEKEFLREALAHMSEDARKRSAEAVRFSEFSDAD